ncbi:hypothetical protein AX15_007171 [Amanita polypyramis BW_CC]|nr:hypothetical protein AX15_007171 [Amanita polypyramis BW_CC]
MSEIDEIFAAKSKAIRYPSIPSASSDDTKKKKRQKNKRRADAAAASPLPQPKKRLQLETIIDPSSDVTHVYKRPKAERAREKLKTRPAPVKDNNGGAKFRDSRGSVSRRTTEEGWPIYGEDELGIHNGGGDTPLCPFDCNCSPEADFVWLTITDNVVYIPSPVMGFQSPKLGGEISTFFMDVDITQMRGGLWPYSTYSALSKPLEPPSGIGL